MLRRIELDHRSKKQILSFFNYHLKKFGDKPEALRWTPQGQLKRFHTLVDIAPNLNNSKILDYGCGTGDFYRFLEHRGISVQYTGVDINPNFIELASAKFPGCTFRTMNIAEETLNEYFDYIFICGVFNLNVPGVQEDLRQAMVELFKYCNKGLALNALSTHAPVTDADLNYTSPEDTLKFAIENLSPSVALRHDRIENDFTLFVYTSLNQIAI
jgi:SAM-dependent methyltransferase